MGAHGSASTVVRGHGELWCLVVCFIEFGTALEFVPCVAPNLDACAFELTNCSSVAPGAACEIRCIPPYVGDSKLASCPIENEDPTRVAEYKIPFCQLVCPDPDPIPVGYRRLAGGWACAEGFTGTVRRSCSRIDNNCTLESTFIGCEARPEPMVRYWLAHATRGTSIVHGSLDVHPSMVEHHGAENLFKPYDAGVLIRRFNDGSYGPAQCTSYMKPGREKEMEASLAWAQSYVHQHGLEVVHLHKHILPV